MEFPPGSQKNASLLLGKKIFLRFGYTFIIFAPEGHTKMMNCFVTSFFYGLFITSYLYNNYSYLVLRYYESNLYSIIKTFMIIWISFKCIHIIFNKYFMYSQKNNYLIMLRVYIQLK